MLEFRETVGGKAVPSLEGRQRGEGVVGGEVAWEDVVQGLPALPLVVGFLVADGSGGCCCPWWAGSGDGSGWCLPDAGEAWEQEPVGRGWEEGAAG